MSWKSYEVWTANTAAATYEFNSTNYLMNGKIIYLFVQMLHIWLFAGDDDSLLHSHHVCRWVEKLSFDSDWYETSTHHRHRRHHYTIISERLPTDNWIVLRRYCRNVSHTQSYSIHNYVRMLQINLNHFTSHFVCLTVIHSIILTTSNFL